MSINELDKLIQQNYIPSASERKKAVMMYFFIGLLIGLVKGLKSDYEKYHFKQALGWWFLFFVGFVISVVIWFIPLLGFVSWLFLLMMIVILGIFVYQAIEGKYTIDKNKILLPIFYGLGSWIYDLFELDGDDTLKDKNYK